MCRYWKKQYTCGCVSHLYRDRCPPCLRSSSEGECDNIENEETPRKSYFMCYPCLVKLDWEEKQQAQQAATTAMELRKKEADKLHHVQRSGEVQIKAEREKQEELRRQRDLKVEQERKRREGGSWVDANKKGRRRNGGIAHASLPPRPPQTEPPMMPSSLVDVFAPLTAQLTINGTNGINAGVNQKNGASISATGTSMPIESTSRNMKENHLNTNITNGNTASKSTGADPGGRAGHWGPSPLNFSGRK